MDEGRTSGRLAEVPRGVPPFRPDRGTLLDVRPPMRKIVQERRFHGGSPLRADLIAREAI